MHSFDALQHKLVQEGRQLAYTDQLMRRTPFGAPDFQSRADDQFLVVWGSGPQNGHFAPPETFVTTTVFVFLLQKVYGASIHQCRPIAYLLVKVGLIGMLHQFL